MVTSCLLDRDKGMQFRKRGPTDRSHLGGSVKLHRAGTQRNHGGVKAEVFALQLF